MDLMIDTLEFSLKKHGFDVTVASPHASHAFRIAGRTAEGAATKAENTKFDTYRIPCEYEDMAICPIGIDVHGAIGTHAKESLAIISKFIANRKGIIHP